MPNQCTVSEASLKSCQENTLCDGCRKSAVIGDGRTSIRHSGRQVPATSQARQTAAEVSDRGSQRYPCKTEAQFLRPVQETVSFKRS